MKQVAGETLEAGYHELILEREGLSAGVYFYRLIPAKKKGHCQLTVPFCLLIPDSPLECGGASPRLFRKLLLLLGGYKGTKSEIDLALVSLAFLTKELQHVLIQMDGNLLLL